MVTDGRGSIGSSPSADSVSCRYPHHTVECVGDDEYRVSHVGKVERFDEFIAAHAIIVDAVYHVVRHIRKHPLVET